MDLILQKKLESAIDVQIVRQRGPITSRFISRQQQQQIDSTKAVPKGGRGSTTDLVNIAPWAVAGLLKSVKCSICGRRVGKFFSRAENAFICAVCVVRDKKRYRHAFDVSKPMAPRDCLIVESFLKSFRPPRSYDFPSVRGTAGPSSLFHRSIDLFAIQSSSLFCRPRRSLLQRGRLLLPLEAQAQAAPAEGPCPRDSLRREKIGGFVQPTRQGPLRACFRPSAFTNKIHQQGVLWASSRPSRNPLQMPILTLRHLGMHPSATGAWPKQERGVSAARATILMTLAPAVPVAKLRKSRRDRVCPQHSACARVLV